MTILIASESCVEVDLILFKMSYWKLWAINNTEKTLQSDSNQLHVC